MTETWQKLADEARRRWLKESPPDQWGFIRDKHTEDVLHDLARRVAETYWGRGQEDMRRRSVSAVRGAQATSLPIMARAVAALPLEPLPGKEG